MEIPANLKYTKDHEWIRVEGNVAVVGVTDYAQSQLGDVVFMDVLISGDSLQQGEVFGAIEAVKTVVDLYMPLSGEIMEFNTDLESVPESVNKDPYGVGWIIKINMANPAEVNGLMSADDYKVFIQQ